MNRPLRALSSVTLGLALGLPLSLAFTPPAAAFGSGTVSTPPAAAPAAKPLSPAAQRAQGEKALEIYNLAVRDIGKADNANADAAAATDPKAKAKASEKASEHFTSALAKLEKVVVLEPSMYQAWNYIGYAKRNLGNYTEALNAYNQALSINPTYAEAIEYRGRAYLGLGRTVEAETAYLTLFARDPKLADHLLVEMKDWLRVQQMTPGGFDPARLAEFGKWIDERARIAGETAGLTPAGAGAHWP